MKKLASIVRLSMLASIVLLATVGASAASAKVCSTAGKGVSCGTGHGNVYTGPIDASLSTPSVAKLVSGFITVTCGESTVSGEVTNGETGEGKITSVTFGDCHSNLNPTSGSCSATTTASSANPWPASVAVTTAPNGTMSVENITGTFICSSIDPHVTCRYVASKAAVAVNGSDTAPTVVATNVALVKEEVSNPSCSEKATWSGTYKVTTPTSLFIT